MKPIIRFIVIIVRVMCHDLFIFVKHLLLEIVCTLGVITVTRDKNPFYQAEERSLIVFAARIIFRLWSEY